MKIYSIPTPDKLREAAEGIKWDKDYRSTMAFANRWHRDLEAYKVTLEIGKSATLVADDGTVRTPLATMYTAAARDFVKELSET